MVWFDFPSHTTVGIAVVTPSSSVSDNVDNNVDVSANVEVDVDVNANVEVGVDVDVDLLELRN